MKKVILLLVLLVPSFAYTKMINIGNNTYINTDFIVVIQDEIKGCAVYLGINSQTLRGITGKYLFDTSCDGFIKQYDIDIKKPDLD